MKCFPSFLSLAICLAACVFPVGAGCASAPDAQATVDSMGKFGNETAKAKDAIDVAIKALETLVGTQGSDLKVPFDAYTKSLAILDGQANSVKKRADEMKSQGDEFFKKWETDSSSSVTPERRAELSASYGRIKEDMAQAGALFTPFQASLNNIQSYLKLDLTVTGINSMGDLTKKAKADGAEVKTRIDAVLVQLNSVRGMLSAKPK